ncbi:MAG TPA: hypothetical protein VF476_00855 [Chitinophagaceae bacterium]
MRHKRKTFHIPKGFKFGLISSVLLLVIVVGGAWYWNNNKGWIIRNKIEDAIAEKTQGLYNVKYDSLGLNEASGRLTVSNLHITYDSAKYIQQASPAAILLNISIPAINVTGIKTPRALLQKEIKGTKVEIRSPEIEIYYTYKGKDSARNVPTEEIYKQILGEFNFIEFDTVLITDAKISTNSLRTGKPIVLIDSVSIMFGAVKIDSASQVDSTRFLFSKQIQLSAHEARWRSANGRYGYKVSDMSFDTKTNIFSAGQFDVDPLLSESNFANKLKYQDDRYDFSFRDVRLTGVKSENILNENIRADSLIISSASLKVYRDIGRPRDKKNRVGSYPHQVINQVPLIFDIRKVIVNSAFVEYKERNPITREAGKVQFYNVNAFISNFSNNDETIRKNSLMTATVNSRFLNKSYLRTNWLFYLKHPAGKFKVKGELSPMDAKQLNVLAEPMGPARIEKGSLNSLAFNLDGNDNGTNAQIKVLYNDLKMSLLELDKGAKETDRKFLASFLANIIIKNDNPKKGEEIRTANINYTRDPNRSLFNLCWKAIFKGVKQTLGVKK